MNSMETLFFWLGFFGTGVFLGQAGSQFRKQKNYGAMWSVYAVLSAGLAFAAWLPDTL